MIIDGLALPKPGPAAAQQWLGFTWLEMHKYYLKAKLCFEGIYSKISLEARKF